jgi:hypothetical protein
LLHHSIEAWRLVPFACARPAPLSLLLIGTVG